MLKEINENICPVEGFVMDPMAGSLSTAHECLRLPKHRVFLGCRTDEEVFQHVRNSLVKTLASVILSDQSDIKTANGDILRNANIVHEHNHFRNSFDLNRGTKRFFIALDLSSVNRAVCNNILRRLQSLYLLESYGCVKLAATSSWKYYRYFYTCFESFGARKSRINSGDFSRLVSGGGPWILFCFSFISRSICDRWVLRESCILGHSKSHYIEV